MTHPNSKTLSAAALAAAALTGLAVASTARPAAVASPGVVANAAAVRTLRFSPEVLDLGELTIGTPGKATMTVTNAGDAPVAIAAIKPACGCTKVSDAPKVAVAPGASFDIEVSLDPGKKPGLHLVRKVHVELADGSTESFEIVARVKTAVRIEPAVLEASSSIDPDRMTLSLASVDGTDFAVTGVVPAGVLSPADARSTRGSISLAVDSAAWEAAGRPTTIVLTTDRADAPELVVPVRSTDAAAMFRLPAAAGGVAVRARLEAQQDALIREIDALLGAASKSPQFRMRLHRESGMLFVHGTAQDLDAVRGAVAALPASHGVRESGSSGSTRSGASDR